MDYTFTRIFAPSNNWQINIQDFSIMRYVPDRDFKIINQWLAEDYARFWGMNALSEEQRLLELSDNKNKFALIAYREKKLEFLVEIYNPQFDEIGLYYNYIAGDCGMHLLLSPPIKPEKGFSKRVIKVIMILIFEHLGFLRVIVEPDISNKKIHPLNSLVGIKCQRIVELSNKTAQLGMATKEDFLQSLNIEGYQNDKHTE